MLTFPAMCCEGRVPERILVAIDSGSVQGTARNFRSSFRGLHFVLRLAGLALGFDLYIEVLWLPTWDNRGDAPSRKAPLAGWT